MNKETIGTSYTIDDLDISVTPMRTDAEYPNKVVYRVQIDIDGFHVYDETDLSVPRGMDPMLCAVEWLSYAASGEAERPVFNDTVDEWAQENDVEIECHLLRDEETGEPIHLG